MGQTALSMLLQCPDFHKIAVADCDMPLDVGRLATENRGDGRARPLRVIPLYFVDGTAGDDGAGTGVSSAGAGVGTTGFSPGIAGSGTGGVTSSCAGVWGGGTTGGCAGGVSLSGPGMGVGAGEGTGAGTDTGAGGTTFSAGATTGASGAGTAGVE